MHPKLIIFVSSAQQIRYPDCSGIDMYVMSNFVAFQAMVALLLEPDSPDAFFRWGFFLEILQRTEYIEGYVIDPMGEAMLQADPELAEEFRSRLQEDEAFAADPQARRRWFYERTPYHDDRWMIYPVARERGSR